MTLKRQEWWPSRQKWWDSLPETQKYLRREISRLKYVRSEEKLRASTAWSVVVKITALKRINYYTAHIRAIKHELDRTTTMIYTGHYEGVSPIYRCEKCGNEIKDIGQWYCSYCGREIKGWRY
jgi:hypothetical protein